MVPNPGGDGEKSEDEKMNEEVVEEIELQEMGDRREEIFYDFKSKMPDATPEEISAAVDAYMKDTYAPRPSRPSGYPGPKGPGRTSGAKFSRPLQETLKRLAKAKNITLRSSGKKIK